jgi:hypothetical protein
MLLEFGASVQRRVSGWVTNTAIRTSAEKNPSPHQPSRRSGPAPALCTSCAAGDCRCGMRRTTPRPEVDKVRRPVDDDRRRGTGAFRIWTRRSCAEQYDLSVLSGWLLLRLRAPACFPAPLIRSAFPNQRVQIRTISATGSFVPPERLRRTPAARHRRFTPTLF